MSSQRIKFCVLGASFGNPNLGVGALMAGVVTSILARYPNAAISILDYAYEPSVQQFRSAAQSVPVQVVNIRFSKKFYLANNVAFLIILSLLLKLVPSKALRRRLTRKNATLRHIEEADAVVSIAGGDSFSDIYGWERLIYVSLPQILILCSGKELVLLPQTLGPFQSTFAKMTAKLILRRARVSCSRDRESIREASVLLGKEASAKLRLCYDVGFVVQPIRPAQLEPFLHRKREDPRCLVGFNVSGLLYAKAGAGGQDFGFKDDYQLLVYQLIDFLVKVKKARVLLVPHVFGKGVDSDSVACAQVHDRLKDKHGGDIEWVRGDYDQNEIKYIIGCCDFLIGSRMHACIAALSQAIPTVAVAYSRKFIGVMQTIGFEEIVVDLRSMNGQEVLNRTDQIYGQREELRRRLQARMPEVQKSVLDLIPQIIGRNIGMDSSTSAVATEVPAVF
jgi:polysaccharide pyruvyl transferase WcaK-like protein